jgi:hypothetical protein
MRHPVWRRVEPSGTSVHLTPREASLNVLQSKTLFAGTLAAGMASFSLERPQCLVAA